MLIGKPIIITLEEISMDLYVSMLEMVLKEQKVYVGQQWKLSISQLAFLLKS